MSVWVYRGETRKIKSVSAKQLAVLKPIVGLFADTWPVLLLLVNVKLIDIANCELGSVDLQVMEDAELFEGRSYE